MPLFVSDLEVSGKLLVDGQLTQPRRRHLVGGQLSLWAIGFLGSVLSDIIAQIKAQQILDRHVQHLGCLQQLIAGQPTVSTFHTRDACLIDANFVRQFHLVQTLGFSCST